MYDGGLKMLKNCKHKKPYYTAKRFRLLQWLMDRGFQPSKTLPDPTNPRYKWWQFENTPELEEAVAAYFDKNKGE